MSNNHMYWMRDFKDQQRTVLMDREPHLLSKSARNLRDLLVRYRDRAVGGGMVLAAAAALALPLSSPEKAKMCLPEGTARQIGVEALGTFECDKPVPQSSRGKDTAQPKM